MLAVIQMMEGLVEAALDPEAPPHEVGDMAQFVVAALQKADAETMNALADLLAPAIDLHSPHAAVTFVLAGALVEAGADPLRVGPAVLAPLSTALEECAEFVTHHEADDATPPPAWMVLNLIWRPAVAVLGSSVDLRATHRGLRAAAMKIEKLHIGGEWLSILLRVLDDEPLLVIHAAQDRAFECRLSGTTTLYELQTLLQIELIGDPSDGWLGGTTPPNEIISCAGRRSPHVQRARHLAVRSLSELGRRAI